MKKLLLTIIAASTACISFSDDMPPEVKRLKEQRDRKVAAKTKEIDAIYHSELNKLKKKYAAQKNYIAAAYIEKMFIEAIDAQAEAIPPTTPTLPETWFGHCIETQPDAVSHFVKHANCVFDHGWLEYGDALIQKARKKGIRVILMFRKETYSEARKEGIALAKNNSDVVVAMCWESPYYDHSKPNDLSQFAKKLKKEVPGIQFWSQFVEKPRGKFQTLPVPPEVDVIVIAYYFGGNGARIEEKSNEALPGWMEKAQDRPVLLYWCAWSKNPPGLVMQCQLGTMKACADSARKHGLSGLILGHYGDRWEHAGIESRPQLEKVIASVAQDFF